MKKTQTCIAAILAILSALLLATVSYLAFVFPKTVQVWSDEGRAISLIEQHFVNLSSACTSFGMVIIPLLLLAFVGCSIWALAALKSTGGAQSETGSKPAAE